MRIAIVVDWLTAFGGAERVIREMLALWPDATVFTTVHRKGIFPHVKDIRTSSLQWWYDRIGNHRILLPWMLQAVESFDLRGFDVILSSSHAIAKGCIPPSGARHICYCHTPMRYAWEMEEQYIHDFRIPHFLRKRLRRKLREIRRWDLTTAKRVDAFIANSSTTHDRITRIYGRESTILHPPVGRRFFEAPINRGGSYFLSVGRLVPYKRIELLIQSANSLHLPLKIVGTGPDAQRLSALAGPTVEFLGYVPDEDLPQLYSGARALLFPVEEDAGIVPLEAQACGTPVVAFAKGGALDTVKDDETGLFFHEQTPDSLGAVLRTFESRSFSAETIRKHANQFSSDRFRSALRSMVEEAALTPSHSA